MRVELALELRALPIQKDGSCPSPACLTFKWLLTVLAPLGRGRKPR